ncbi:15212_t:CDS:2, partial [Gigaspora margarita]
MFLVAINLPNTRELLIQEVIEEKSKQGCNRNADQLSTLPKVKCESRRFPTISYKSIKHLLIGQGFNDPKVAKTESKRLWLVLNWNKEQKTIEIL